MFFKHKHRPLPAYEEYGWVDLTDHCRCGAIRPPVTEGPTTYRGEWEKKMTEPTDQGE